MKKPQKQFSLDDQAQRKRISCLHTFLVVLAVALVVGIFWVGVAS